MSKSRGRKKRKQERKQKNKQSQNSSEINQLARYLATQISKMTPPYHDKRGDTFIDENFEGGCVVFGGKWGELSYCKDCWYNQPPKVPSTRSDVTWVGCHKRGTWKWRLIGKELVKP